ncbi:hypothetical protein AZJ77_11155 [Streptococcus pneumoniae]|nr:hypothetical protein AZJ77_11155 [Streptococcus pneumoniae]
MNQSKRKSNNLWITFTFLSFLSTFFKQAKKLDMTCLKAVFHRFHRLYYYYYLVLKMPFLFYQQ